MDCITCGIKCKESLCISCATKIIASNTIIKSEEGSESKIKHENNNLRELPTPRIENNPIK
jgi:CO dehydrogenase/acetyl-CoA synthase gamma subunit (corrinoid Fe-S protein)